MLLTLMLCWVKIVIDEVHEGEAFAETGTSFFMRIWRSSKIGCVLYKIKKSML